MRLKPLLALIVLTALIGASCSPAEDNRTIHAAFFSVGLFTEWQDNDALDDFLYYYNQLKPWLDNEGIAYSFSRELPVVVSIKGQTKTFNRESLEVDLGLVLLDDGGRSKILYGVLTDVDWQIEINNFTAIESPEK